MGEITKQWYVVRAIGGKEKKVKEYIEAEIRHSHLEEYISQVLIPTEKVYTIRNGKKVSKEKVSYPGYVLIEAALVGQIPIIIRNIPNVLGFLSESKSSIKPAPVSQAEINKIMGNVDEMAADTLMEETFLEGERVKVITGAFNGFEGVINEVSQDKRKLKVVVTIFDRQTPLELGFDQVAKE